MANNLFDWIQDILSIAGNIAELVGLAILVRSMPSTNRPPIRQKKRSYQ